MAIQGTPLQRWGDVFLYAVGGALAAVPLGLAVGGALEALLAPTPSPLLRNLAFGGIALVLLELLRRQSGTRWGHFRTLGRYPSTLVAVPIALGLLAGLLALQNFEGWTGAETSRLCGALCSLSGAATIAVLAAWWIANRRQKADHLPKPGPPADLDALLTMPFDQLQHWLSSEESITDAADDYFGADDRARRIAQVLQTPRKNRRGQNLRQTVVVQGAFGSGKSSVMQLVKHYIRENGGEQFIFVEVKCWGFSSVAAQEHVLEKAVEGLSAHVDCLALRRLPAAYVEALSGASSWLGGLFRAMGSGGTPTDQLKRFTPILDAIDAQLVIVVEDTDRNGPDFDQKHIEAMLHNFRDVERVSFVLTAGRDSEIDFAKIAEHTFFIQVPPEEKILAILDRVRTHCRTSGPWMDPSPSESEDSRQGRPTSLLATASAAREVSRAMGFGGEVWPLSVAALLDTPRKLKRTLTSVLERWKNLCGEVDLDELIMVTALRHAAPAVYSFLGSNFHELQVLEKSEEREFPEKLTRRENRIRDLKRRWLRALRQTKCDAYVVGKILAELLPWSANITGIASENDGGRQQSIKGPRGDLYWQRITTESLSAGEIRDQDVLGALRDATSDEGIVRLGQLATESRDFVRLVTFFNTGRPRIEGAALLRAASTALRILRPFKMDWRDVGSSTFREVLGWLEMARVGADALEDWFTEEMFACLPSHLADANTLYFDMKSDRLGKSSSQEVRRRFVQRFKQTFESADAKGFAAGFEVSPPFTLGYLVRPELEHTKPFISENEEDWRWLAPLLLRGMEEFPQVMVPQVMLLFGVYGPVDEAASSFNYNEAETAAFFGADLPRAVALLAQPFPMPENLDGMFSLDGPLGTKKAEEWLARLQSEGAESAEG